MKRVPAWIHSLDKRALLSERCDETGSAAVRPEDALQCKSGRFARYEAAINATFCLEALSQPFSTLSHC